jgi:hypothetical protein
MVSAGQATEDAKNKVVVRTAAEVTVRMLVSTVNLEHIAIHFAAASVNVATRTSPGHALTVPGGALETHSQPGGVEALVSRLAYKRVLGLDGQEDDSSRLTLLTHRGSAGSLDPAAALAAFPPHGDRSSTYPYCTRSRCPAGRDRRGS